MTWMQICSIRRIVKNCRFPFHLFQKKGNAMPRTARLVVPGQQTVYHVMSRTALDGFPLQDAEKDYLVSLIRKLSNLFLVEILGFCCMGNHFHLLVKTFPDADFSDEEIKQRFVAYYGKDRDFYEGQIPYLRQKWSSISEFVKEIKQTFSRFFNRRHDRRGYFWGERFKSVIVEKGETLVNCLAYIDLNPVRAGLVEKPEDYRWNSIGYHLQTGNREGFLSLDFGLKEFGVLNPKERLKRYRRYLYETGAVDRGKGTMVKTEVLERERQKKFTITRADRFRHRTRYFTDSGIIGTREFVQDHYRRFEHLFHTRREKVPKRVAGLEGLYSLKRLAE